MVQNTCYICNISIIVDTKIYVVLKYILLNLFHKIYLSKRPTFKTSYTKILMKMIILKYLSIHTSLALYCIFSLKRLEGMNRSPIVSLLEEAHVIKFKYEKTEKLFL